MTEADLRTTVEVYERLGRSKHATAREMGIARSTVRDRLTAAEAAGMIRLDGLRQRVIRRTMPDGSIEVTTEPLIRTGGLRAFFTDDAGIRHYGYASEADLRAAAVVPDNYSTVSFSPNSWAAQDSTGAFIAHQVKACFKPPSVDEVRIELRGASPKVAARHQRAPSPSDLCLEISIADPHVGMVMHRSVDGEDYSIDIACDLYRNAVRSLAEMATVAFGKPAQILLPIGNDYLHCDNIGHTTTSGTLMQDADDWHYTYIAAERLLIDEIVNLSLTAPVRVLQIPGNHDRQTMFTIGRVLAARFWNDDNVDVDASPATYKSHRWGCNLVAFDHGRDIQPSRLAAIMANTWPQDWAETRYREWHLGDQHRKGVAVPSVLEEQGVAVEFLPSLAPASAWSRRKGFSNATRSAQAWVWDKERGPLARLQVGI